MVHNAAHNAVHSAVQCGTTHVYVRATAGSVPSVSVAFV